MFHLSSIEFSHFLLATAALLALAHILGFLAEKLIIPRVIGEVGAGIILGPTLLGYFFPDAFQWLFLGYNKEESLLALMYQLGLMMLMFCSGLRFQTKLEKGDGKITTAIVIGSTILPFTIGWLATSMFNLEGFLGPAQNMFAIKIVMALSIAVTSIPVISKIFNDLGIMHSRFAKLVIACAGFQDIFLYIALGIATAVAGSSEPVTLSSVLTSVVTTLAFIGVSLVALKFIFKKLINFRGNVLFRASNIGYILLFMFMTAGIAGYLQVEAIFGALITGIAAKSALPESLATRLEESVSNISFSWFIPVYFAIVGLQLNLTKHFDWLFFAQFLVFATIAETLFVYFSSRMIKQDHLTSLNFGLAMNARGGPGIVMSTIAFSAGIINQEMFGILVVLALVSSWFAGSWLRLVLKKGWRLMPGDENLVTKRFHDDPFTTDQNEKK